MPGTRKLGKSTDQRMAMLRQQVTDLLDSGKMTTTVTRDFTSARGSSGALQSHPHIHQINSNSTNSKSHLTTVNDTGQNVTTIAVAAEEMFPAWFKQIVGYFLFDSGVIGDQQGADQNSRCDDQQHDHADHGAFALFKAAPNIAGLAGTFELLLVGFLRHGIFVFTHVKPPFTLSWNTSPGYGDR